MMARQVPRKRKPSKKQIAMIAQKIIDANQTHWEWRPFVASSDTRTAAFRTPSQRHYLLIPALRNVRDTLCRDEERVDSLAVSLSRFQFDPYLRF